MNVQYQSLIETESAAILRLLSTYWQDTQSIDDWKRIAFQLDGAAIISRRNQPELSSELAFLSSLAFNRVYIMQALEMDEAIALKHL